jgi:MFS family permease
MISSTAGGSLAKYGKRKMIFLMSIIMSIGVAFSMFNNMIMITLGRFIIGLGAGGFCSYSPAYISELAPTEMTGTLGAVS